MTDTPPGPGDLSRLHQNIESETEKDSEESGRGRWLCLERPGHDLAQTGYETADRSKGYCRQDYESDA